MPSVGLFVGTFLIVEKLRPVTGSAAEIRAALELLRADPDPAYLVLSTSGSTGDPKRVMLSREAMTYAAEATQAQLEGPGQWVLNLPPTRVAGLMVLWRSVLSGIEPVIESDLSALTPESISGGSRSFLSLVPTQLQRALDQPSQVEVLKRFTTVLIGGGAMMPGLRSKAEAAGINLVATYGMTETCGGCVYDGAPLPGVEVKSEGTEHELFVRGPMLFSGYVGGARNHLDSDGWYPTGDQGRVEEGRVSVHGRLDDMINTGGVKVPAAVVAQRLREHPQIEFAEVIGVPDPAWGERVVAVLSTDLPLPHVRDFVSLALPRHWAPQQVIARPSMPTLDSGKVDRVRLRELVAGDLTAHSELHPEPGPGAAPGGSTGAEREPW